MTELSDARLLELAAAQNAGGDWAAAESSYRRLLAARPGDASVLHEIGVLAIRGGLSLLSNVGLPELAAFKRADHVRLAALRAGLRARMQTSPLMDADRFTRGIEAAYRAIWRDFCGRKAAR